MVKFMTVLCNQIVDTGKWPSEWSRSVFVPLPKVSGTKRCEEHRTISLISHCSKILLRILLNRMQNDANREINEVQMGFRKGVGTRDQIFNIRMLAEKSREFNQPIFVAFIDYSKAFDSVSHNKLWKVMEELSIRPSIIKLIRSLYKDQEAAIKVENELSEWFKIEKGVRQGCLLSPLCFNLYTEYIMRASVDNHTSGTSINGRRINNLRYADDIALIAKSAEELQELLSIVNNTSKEFGLQINAKKTKVMTIGQERKEAKIKCEGKTIEQVEHFKYLGTIITETADCSKEIRARLGQGREAIKRLANIWKSRSVSLKNKISIATTLVWPVVTYGCEAWTLKQADIKRIEAFEMFCYRRILRVSWTDRRTNLSVLGEIGREKSLLRSIKSRKLKYFGHITRAGGISAEILQGMTEGKRKRGRQKTRWSDNIVEWTGKTMNECTRTCQDRHRWRKLEWTATRIADPQS